MIAVINESGRKKRGGCRSQEQGEKEDRRNKKAQSLQMEEKLEAAWKLETDFVDYGSLNKLDLILRRETTLQDQTMNRGRMR